MHISFASFRRRRQSFTGRKAQHPRRFRRGAGRWMLPTIHPRTHFVVRLKANGDDIGQHKLTFRWLSPFDEELWSSSGEMSVAPSPNPVFEVDLPIIAVSTSRSTSPGSTRCRSRWMAKSRYGAPARERQSTTDGRQHAERFGQLKPAAHGRPSHWRAGISVMVSLRQDSSREPEPLQQKIGVLIAAREIVNSVASAPEREVHHSHSAERDRHVRDLSHRARRRRRADRRGGDPASTRLACRSSPASTRRAARARRAGEMSSTPARSSHSPTA